MGRPEFIQVWAPSGNKWLRVVIAKALGEFAEINEGSHWGIFRKQVALELAVRKTILSEEKSGKWGVSNGEISKEAIASGPGRK